MKLRMLSLWFVCLAVVQPASSENESSDLTFVPLGNESYVSVDLDGASLDPDLPEVVGVSRLNLTEQQQTFPLPPLSQAIESLLPNELSSAKEEGAKALALQFEVNEVMKRHTGF